MFTKTFITQGETMHKKSNIHHQMKIQKLGGVSVRAFIPAAVGSHGLHVSHLPGTRQVRGNGPRGGGNMLDSLYYSLRINIHFLKIQIILSALPFFPPDPE